MKARDKENKRQDYLWFNLIMVIWLGVLTLVFASSYNINFMQFIMAGMAIIAMIFAYNYGVLRGLVFVLILVFAYGSYILYGVAVTGEISELRIELIMWLFIMPLGAYLSGQMSQYIASLYFQSGEWQMLRERLTKDDLTGFLNKRGFFEALEREIDRTRRFKDPLSILIIKIANLNEMRTVYGEVISNAIIKSLSEQIDNVIRSIDIKGMLETDVIGIILPETNISGARVVAEKLHNLVELITVDLKKGRKTIKLRISVGIAEYSDTIPDAYTFYAKAFEDADRDVG
ncbi:GGDEF domain-containing protein [Thermosyntropha sp.]|uniref:GGDEF domain-containing protein n=1 Tax=Thermosyntropha sp. TaxID=2740820 RepID=UPI0025E0A35E|nr:GGDEF domain-containing protein [Thermosyntropha sp.]MBO8159574.1 GGDEF domain-containing protein [Thermosyntropha sp.]